MATAHPWVGGRTIPVPQFHISFCPNPSNLDFSFNRSSSFCVSLGPSPLFASPSSLRSPRNSSLSCRCSSSNVNGANSSSCGDEWDWNRWSRHFSEVEDAESLASLIKFQLEEAIEKEDFQEAAKLKTAIAEATSVDTVSEIMSQLQTAIREERYHDASRLCRETGSGLVGWWVGFSPDSEDPFGRIVHITPGVGRFIGKSYSPRQLVTAATGTPLFEIFVVKGADEEYVMKVVYLQRAKRNSFISKTSSLRAQQSSSDASTDKPSMLDMPGSEGKGEKAEDRIMNAEEATEEGIKSVINFLKDKIPGLKLKVMNVKVTEEDILGDDDTVDQLAEDDAEETSSSDESEETDNADVKDLDSKLFLGGVLHNTDDITTKDELVRVSAAIRDIEKDSFVLHIPERITGDDEIRTNKMSKVQVTAVAAHGLSELMPPEVAKAFWGSEKASSKVSRNVRDIVKLAINQAQKRNQLSEVTTFNRIITSEGNLDPFDGLYVGAFGPYGTEIVQLKRKYGQWNDAEGDNSSDVEFFEYVEAVKLTGDPNVPAGQVTFRAKIGRGNRLSSRGMYPEELGVVAGYKGQGRIADFGFKNPKWVEGELLQLNGKGMGSYVKGADLGLLYVVPEQSFLVLFNRLRLPE